MCMKIVVNTHIRWRLGTSVVKWCNLVPSVNYCEHREAEFETPLLGTRGGWTRLNFIKMAEISLIDFSYLTDYLSRLLLRWGPSFKLKVQGWGQS